MSLIDFCKKKNKKSTRQEMGARTIDELGVETYKREYLVYFLIKPSNIAVLSESNVRAKILALMSLYKGIDNLEIACINSRENFENNKIYMKKRLTEEKNQNVRDLLNKDLTFLDRIQIQTASAREFLVILRFRENEIDTSEVGSGISRLEKLLKDQGFNAKRATKEDIKRIFAVYYVQNLTQIYFDDYDGEHWVKGDDVY